MLKRLTIILLFTSAAGTLMAGTRPTGLPFATRSEVLARHGMACTSQPLATQAAIYILRQGGNAVDAAIAANAMQCLTEPVCSGLGGDIFVQLWDAKTKKLYGYNGSGRSPQSLTLDYLTSHGATVIPSYGPLPVSVPGCVDGWFAVHDRFGKLPMSEVLAPAIEAAREGIPVEEYTAFLWARGAPNFEKYPNYKETYEPNGHTPRKGEIFKNPNLANTLEEIAKGGRDAFYKGRIAHVIADYMHRNGGFLSYDDLASHKGEWVEPVSTNYRGYDVWELPPNGQGISVLQMLNILEGYDLKDAGYGTARYLHLLIETEKLVYEDRAKFISDPEFNKIPVQWLISKEYAAQRRKLIDEHKASLEYPAGEDPAAHGDTIYLTTADNDGNMVSLIQSNYRGQGSGMTPDGLGIMLQDRGELFSLKPGQFNTFAPGKRPFHTIIPAFVTKDGQPYMSFGVMGGEMQPQGQTEVLVNMIDFGMNLQEAGDAPRMCHEGDTDPNGTIMTDGGEVHLEPGLSPWVYEELRRMGHKIIIDNYGYGGYQAIMWNPATHVYTGASESRSDGMAAGY